MRTILISGANRGIGLNIAYRELKEGNRISAGVRDIESIKGSIIDPNKWPKGKIIINKYDALIWVLRFGYKLFRYIIESSFLI